MKVTKKQFDEAVSDLTNISVELCREAQINCESIVNIYFAQQQQKTARWVMYLTILTTTVGVIGIAISIYATFFK